MVLLNSQPVVWEVYKQRKQVVRRKMQINSCAFPNPTNGIVGAGFGRESGSTHTERWCGLGAAVGVIAS